MARFFGDFTHNVDEKGRMIMPQRFRDLLTGTVMMTRGVDRNLIAYDVQSWDKLLEYLEPQLNYMNEDHREFLRHFVNPAEQCEIDKLGRCLIPKKFREYGNIGSEVFISGAINKIEIWDSQRYKCRMDKDDPLNGPMAGEPDIKEIIKRMEFVKL